MPKFNPAEHFIPLKGKDYLQVAWRLVWFREDHPAWGIETQLLDHDAQAGTALFRAEITDTENGKVVSVGHGSESKRDFGDYLEKAETKAIGRALAILGYGTQFAPELDEEERIVDSPIDRKKKPPVAVSDARSANDTPKEEKTNTAKNTAHRTVCTECGSEILPRKAQGVLFTREQLINTSVEKYGKALCFDCCVKSKNGGNSNA